MRKVMALTLIAGACAGCVPQASEGGFDSPDPAAKLYAIHRAGEQRDRSALPHLVEQLDSDDPAVRMMSITALKRITGERFGYNPYVAVPQRRQAADRWIEAVRSGWFDVSPNQEVPTQP